MLSQRASSCLSFPLSLSTCESLKCVGFCSLRFLFVHLVCVCMCVCGGGVCFSISLGWFVCTCVCVSTGKSFYVSVRLYLDLFLSLFVYNWIKDLVFCFHSATSPASPFLFLFPFPLLYPCLLTWHTIRQLQFNFFAKQ